MNSVPERRFPPSVHAYCASSALCVAFSEDRQRQPTCTVEFAEKARDSGYVWSQKIPFQLAAAEIAELCAFLLFPSKSLQWVHQGIGGTSKRFRVSSQSTKIVFSIDHRGRSLNVPVIPRDQYLIRNLLLSRLQEIQPALSPDLHLASLRRLADQFH